MDSIDEGGSGQPIGDPDPSTGVTDTHRGGPQSIRGRGRQLATPTLPLRSPATSVGTSDPRGEVDVVDWWPRPRIYQGLRVRGPRSIRGRGRQSATPTPLSRSPVSTEVANNQGRGVKVADWWSRP
ncbi:hypothetical protein CRG98_032881 [Punica granatum]|uniref:Uncharacterized protein n=1 Tax=Punica granatum TaxID=22663 RepID=A0A2I0IRX6_PUNGR|nr:hypothetical protein CRG98_032881 [Punica granatum]